eukprot:6483489-Alexandrium_andersonii.AAC.1
MSASLVGSEMCIRDRIQYCDDTLRAVRSPRAASDHLASNLAKQLDVPVSYTHLTLPTICSV